MSIEEVHIELNREGDSFAADEEVVGVAYIIPSKECQCREMTAKMSWYVYGDDEQQKFTVEKKRLFSGSWTPYQSYSYPFSLSVSPGPYSYQGEGIHVDWVISIKLKLQDGQVRTAKRRITVNPAPQITTYHPGQIGQLPLELSNSGEASEPREYLGMTPKDYKYTQAISGTIVILITSAILIGGLVYTIAYGGFGNTTSSASLMIAMIVGFGAIATLLMYTISVTIPLIEDIRQGIFLLTPELDVAPDIVQPGGQVNVTYLVPQHIREASNLSVKLVGNEKLAENRTGVVEHKQWTLHTDTRPLIAEDGEYDPSFNANRFDVSFQIPEDAAFSLYSMNHTIQWEIQASYLAGGTEEKRTTREVGIFLKGTQLPEQ
jgi:hypothetical protein